MNIDRFYKENQSRRALVIGDLILEEYVHGRVEGFSHEAPIAEVRAESRSQYPSGAGYAAIQLQNLGLNVLLCGVVGDDANGMELLRLVEQKGIAVDHVLREPGLATPRQTHISVYGDHYPAQDLLKVKPQAQTALSQECLEKLLMNAAECMASVDVVVLVDSTGKIINPEIIKSVKAIAKTRNIPIVGDSETNIELLNGCDAITINEQEAARFLGKDRFDLQHDTKMLEEKLCCGDIYLTLGRRGLTVLRQGFSPLHIGTEPIPVFDVRGAGETVLACVAAGKAAGASPFEIGNLANAAAGIVVSKPGLTDVTIAEIKRFEQTRKAGLLSDKIKSLDALKSILAVEKSRGKKIVWTNGCYDIMHVGHILYLEKARELGDLLVVGLNSDESVRKSKGPNRPIVEENQRAKLLASLSFVDYVIIFNDQSPKWLIEVLKPDIYAKGGDYTIDTINQEERRLVESYGGEIALLPGIDGMSTTNIIDKILTVYRD